MKAPRGQLLSMNFERSPFFLPLEPRRCAVESVSFETLTVRKRPEGKS
jgi:hypothetical protein